MFSLPNWPSTVTLMGGLLTVPLTLIVALVLISSCQKSSSPSQTHPEIELSYVGQNTCQSCHRQEARRWSDSHHDLAMQHATDSTVRASFDSTTVRQSGESARFFESDSSFYVRTEGPDGPKQAYPIRYTFGVTPLQQYLVEASGGRLQTLNFSWDTEKKEWFHLYPDEQLQPNDPLHWTGRLRTWNTTCASCHSTDFRKNYDAQSDTYASTWSEIDVSCEACHGPGSRHVTWAYSAKEEVSDTSEEKNTSAEKRPEPNDRYGTFKNGEGTYGLTVNLDTANSQAELQTCARCHSRRQKISTEYRPGDTFLNHYVPQLLREGLYHPDGQIDDEVYVYGSFLQSEMYQQGVQCADCHEPHSLELRLEGNALCTQCHSEATYDTTEHHFHPESSSGASCANCHMPEKTYMQIDNRRDHSIRVPRPDLSVELGTPNACTRCHTDRSNQWAVRTTDRWYGNLGSDSVHYGEVFATAQDEEPEAKTALIRTARDTGRPSIVRATALSLLKQYHDRQVTRTLREGLNASSPLMRWAAIGGLQQRPSSERIAALGPLLSDSIRSVRIEAARTLAPLEGRIPPKVQDPFKDAFDEFVNAMRVTSERPQSQLQLGQAYQQRDQTRKARDAYKRALRIDSSFLPALTQLARLHNQEGRNGRAESLLRRAVSLHPEHGEAHYMLGLLLAESEGVDTAVSPLETAAQLLSDRPRVQYNYGLALQQLGQREKAEEPLSRAHELRPESPDFLYALAVLHVQQNQWQEALSYAQKLADLQPRSRRAQQLLRRVQRKTDVSTRPEP